MACACVAVFLSVSIQISLGAHFNDFDADSPSEDMRSALRNRENLKEKGVSERIQTCLIMSDTLLTYFKGRC